MKAPQVSRPRRDEDEKSLVRWAFPGLFIQEKDIWNGAGILLITLLLYGGLVLCIGKPFHPSGNAWAVMIIWLLASAGGWLVERVGLPGPLGMILTGIAVGNIKHGHLVKGLPASWSKELRAIALAIIFLRSGLELDLRIFKKVGWVATRLLLLPGILEAFFDGGLAVALFGMPATFAFALGFILKAVGPALVIQCMFDVQSKRLGTAKSIPATVVAAASFDDMIGITGYTIFIDIAVKGDGNQYNFTSGGALGSLTLGLCVKELWARGTPGMFAVPETNHEYTRNVEKNVRWLWRFIMMPVLFGLIGNALRFNTLQHSSTSKACAIIFAGLAVRMPATFLVMFGGGFTWKERLFFSFAWTPKATVQAALALSPLDAVIAAYKSAPKSAQALRYTQYANETLTTAIFCILIDASIGTLLIRAFAPALLQREAENHAEAPGAPMVPGLQPPSPRPMVHDPLDRQENEPQQLTAAELARQQQLMHHKEQEFAMANEAMLAEFMEQIDQIADVVGQTELGHPDGSDCAGKLRLAVDDLRDRIAEHDYLKAEEVEGANDFLRATRQEHETLRRRGPGRQSSAASPSGLGNSSEAV
ncbi:hypothetical protein WJX79_003931 [Trebouxia sp. C0005]